eukprot:5649334-Pyramimonas_sp.AAC.1
MTPGTNTTRKICHISSLVVELLYVRTILDYLIFENNQWAFGWIRYHHGLHWPNARALGQ